MSDINVNFTIPKELISGAQVKRTDHGPFYFFTPAMPVHRVDYKDSVPHIYPCEVAVCTDWVERLPEHEVPPGTAVHTEVERDQVGNQLKFGVCIKPADAIRALIHEMYHELGVVEISAFAHKDAEEARVDFFNSFIYPVKIEPDSVALDPTLEEMVRTKGGLFARRRLVEEGLRFISSGEFLDGFGKERQVLYQEAASECLKAFHKANDYVQRQLAASDADIRLRLANAGGKPTYDPRDAYFQWLLARRPIMESQASSEATGQPIVVNVPAQGGITAEQLEAILARVATATPLVQAAGMAEEPTKRGPGRPKKTESPASE